MSTSHYNTPTSAAARQWNFQLPIAGMVANRRGDWIAVALGDGTARLLSVADSETAMDDATAPQERHLHDNGVTLSLAADSDDHAFLSGGDDGRVVLFEPHVDEPVTLVSHKGKWIDSIASSPTTNDSTTIPVRAYSAGRDVYLLDRAGQPVVSPLPHPATPSGIAFSPNGEQLAVARYGGVSLWTFLTTGASDPENLEWAGSHVIPLWHPSGELLVTTMQENALHGWRLADKVEMRMQGYPDRVRSLAFTAQGRYLATSGMEQIICWPFFDGGPWNKEPLALGSNSGRMVTAIAPHPTETILVAGYNDGMIVMAPLDGRLEVLLAPPNGHNITAMVWNAAGDCLIIVAESDGTVRLFTHASIAAFAHRMVGGG